MEYEVEGPRPRGRPKRTWREVVWEDCQARKLNKEDAMDRCKWRKLIKDDWWSGWVWVGECFFWYRPTRVVPDKRPLNGCVCVCACVCVPGPHNFRISSPQRIAWLLNVILFPGCFLKTLLTLCSFHCYFMYLHSFFTCIIFYSPLFYHV